MFSGQQVVDVLSGMGISHVVLLPDSTLGEWEEALFATPKLRVVRVCREGEAWGVAAGLYLGGASPVGKIQCTGLFESGDALRNTLYDYQLPLFAIIGYRSYLNREALPGDTCPVFTEPVLKAWDVDYRLVDDPSKIDLIPQHYRTCRAAGKAGAVLIGEGKA